MTKQQQQHADTGQELQVIFTFIIKPQKIIVCDFDHGLFMGVGTRWAGLSI